ncbi:MAG: hypothetical protein HY308_14625 [Gammaproteobacteria bacterium]|nr:hypothetical protein [Gammaproteobacteria bacterium]
MKNLGTLLLGVWLVATGLRAVIHLNFTYDTVVLGALAIVTGVLIALKR